MSNANANCECNRRLNYQQQGENDENIGKNRKRNIIWFNPSYSKLWKTNIGKHFLRLLNKNIPLGYKLRKIFPRNTLKHSYSDMANLKAKIDGHNKKMLENWPPSKTKMFRGEWERPTSQKIFYTTLK